MGYDEIFGTLFGLLSVILTIRQSIWCWPTGLVNVTLFAVMFFRTKLYADVGVMGVYFVLSVYGWYRWTHPGRSRKELPVTHVKAGTAAVLALLAVAGAIGLGTILDRQTDAALPYWNSTTAAMSLVAQWMLARKLLQNWLVWIAADVLMVGIYFSQGLYPTSALYVVFLVLAASGYREWRKDLKTAQPA